MFEKAVDGEMLGGHRREKGVCVLSRGQAVIRDASMLSFGQVCLRRGFEKQ